MFIAVALLVAGLFIAFLLHHFIQRQVDERLDSQILFLASMLRADNSTLSLSGSADGPPFDRPARGWYWQVTGPDNTLRARALGDKALDLSSASLHPPPRPPRDDRDPPRAADGDGPNGQSLHYRIKSAAVSGVPVDIVASAPRAAVMDPLLDAMTMLGLSLTVLGVALVLAMLLQVRLGLRPLAGLRNALADVRAGRSDHVPAEQPIEVQPLVTELNALLDQNTANLERARGHVANLAHGLKTPLATLAVALSRERASNGELAGLVDVMERRIRHHLGRARTAALSGPVRARTNVADHLAALGDVLAKVNADRQVAFTVDAPAGLAVACEQQDFDEIAGNLLENAFKWTRSTIVARAETDPQGMVMLAIEDDGPGLQPDEIERAQRPGQRLDETAPGFGFGLSITRELAELYGGSLAFARASLGGLRVVLRLPVAR